MRPSRYDPTNLKGTALKMLCPKKHDQWKCSGGYDQAYENLVLTSAIKPKIESKPDAEQPD